MTWFIFSMCSIFVLATAELTQQYLLNMKNAFDARSSAVLTFLFQSLLAIPFLFIFDLSDQIFSIFNSEIFPKVASVSFISSISMILYLKSFKVKNISISTILISFSVVVSTLLGILFLSESVNYLKLLGIAMIIIAIATVKYQNIVLEKNHFYGFLASIIFGVSYALDKSIVLDIHPFVYIFWTFLFISIWGFVFGIRKVARNIKGRILRDYVPILISGVAYFMFNSFTFLAYRYGGEIGRIDAINNAQIILIILFEYFFLKHTEGVFKKMISAILAIIGVYLLGIA